MKQISPADAFLVGIILGTVLGLMIGAVISYAIF